MAKRKSPVSAAITPTDFSGYSYPIEVPKRFMLAGIEWTVEDINHLADLGECERDTATIKLRAGLSPQIRSQTFYHELMHAILFATGLQDHSEKEVDLMGALLHQFELTRRNTLEP